MKTTKKIFAAVLAVMMIALMIPFSASAVDGDSTESYSAKYKLAVDAADTDKVGDYTFSFFKIADLDLTTGKYSSTITDTALKNAVNGAYSDTKSQNILTACDTLYKNNKEAFGTAATTISFSSTVTEATATVTDPGLYYVYCTSKPAKVTGVQSSLASLPYFDGTNYVSVDQTEHNLAEKVSTSSVTVDKSADKTYVGDNNKTVTYTLTASTAGSIDNQLKKYEIVDTMDEGLTFNENSVVVKYDGTGDALTLGTDYSIEKNHPYTGKNGEATATFAVVFKSATLESENFYNADTVVVTYTADLNEKAKLNTALDNTDGLVYGNDAETNFESGKNSPDVFTYGMKVVKVNGNDTTQKLADAEFQIFTDAEAKTPLTVDGKNVVAKTGANGEATFVLEGTTTTFKFDATKTYYAKETAAPTGYNLNSSVFTVSIDKSKEYTFVGNTAEGEANKVVPNYPVTVPKTGGMGTMMFYVGGAALIACAGVLLFVLKRKKAAK
ncbi:isopeptide-forming domain-containing fimbrial protein [Ruminococcus bromii]|nr:SpaH/EbpB family LPXTG-anchored major pilin [Ruminococcus bromii]RGI79665.1 isopeptide-forming domain-containing fimbrial protein [Ruminococcus bromii]RGI83339.1 isopeptide-forming domain-containing fimbrial protein [Ruminococcus bromii]